jgi:hypothetical protein
LRWYKNLLGFNKDNWSSTELDLQVEQTDETAAIVKLVTY